MKYIIKERSGWHNEKTIGFKFSVGISLEETGCCWLLSQVNLWRNLSGIANKRMELSQKQQIILEKNYIYIIYIYIKWRPRWSQWQLKHLKLWLITGKVTSSDSRNIIQKSALLERHYTEPKSLIKYLRLRMIFYRPHGSCKLIFFQI